MEAAREPIEVHGQRMINAFRLMCDEIESTIAELTGRGVHITGPISDAAFGLVTGVQLPGGGIIELCEPRHETAYDL